MRVLVACEYSGIVREAFKAKGHDALSCDLLPTEIPGYHWEGDIFECLKFHHYNFDLMIGHPECKYLCFSGERWINEIPGRQELRQKAFAFFKKLYNVPIPKICIENSHSIFLNREFKKPTQGIHPYHFGSPFKKLTCLWLKGLNPLMPTNILSVGNRVPACWLMPPSKDRSKLRAKTDINIANAMADQWG